MTQKNKPEVPVSAEPAAQCIRCQALIEPGTGAGGLCPACAN